MRGSSWVCASCKKHLASAKDQRASLKLPIRSLTTSTHRRSDASLQPAAEQQASSAPSITAGLSQWHRQRLSKILRKQPQTPQVPHTLISSHVSSMDMRQATETGYTEESQHYPSRSAHLEALRQLDPSRHISSLPNVSKIWNLRGRKSPAFGFLNEREKYIKLLSDFWESSLHQYDCLSLTEYRLFLRYTALIAHSSLAQQIWDQMETSGVTPDVDCYNSLMESLIFEWRNRLPQSKRARHEIPRRFDIPRWTPVNLSVAGGSQKIVDLVREMTHAGLEPDTRTYSALIRAFGIDGQLRPIEEILSSKYGVNVGEGQRPDLQSQYDRYMPAPSVGLLLAIVDAFGLNARVPLALRAVDQLSKRDSVPLTGIVWERLLFWSNLHARNHKDANVRHQNYQFCENIFKIATTAPYNIEPSTEMLYCAGSNAQGLIENDPEAENALLRSMKLSNASAKHFVFRMRRRTGSDRRLAVHSASQTLRRSRQMQMRSVYMLRMLRRRLTRWLSPLSDDGAWDRWQDWHMRGIPDTVLRNSRFLAPVLRYNVKGGIVRLVLRTAEEEISLRQQRRQRRKRRQSEKL